MTEDLITVHNAGTLEEADIVVAWLDNQGIKAMVKDRHSISAFSGISAISHNEIEVCVTDPGEAEKARELLANREHEPLSDEEESGNEGD